MADCHIYKLPNELLLQILTPFPTPDLLPLTTLSHRIYALILRILHNRLLAASTLQSHSLLLECYHPSAKLTEPPYFCAYRGTDGLTSYNPHSGAEDADITKRLGEMRGMYSRFRPYRRELSPDGRRVRRSTRPGDVPGSRTFPIPGTASDGFEGEAVRQILSLEGGELFTQLVAQLNLVKIGPRNGLYTSFTEVEEGVVRVWRDWLKDMAEESVDEKKGKEKVLWVDGKSRNTGLRFRVREKKIRRNAPILFRADEEDLPVSYEVEYDEVLIRTSHLVLVFEKSLLQEDNSSGKAVVFGSFG